VSIPHSDGTVNSYDRPVVSSRQGARQAKILADWSGEAERYPIRYSTNRREESLCPTVSQTKPSAPDRRTINVTDLRTETREILENAQFLGRHYIVHRAGQPMIAIGDHEEYERLLSLAAGGSRAVAKAQASGRPV